MKTYLFKLILSLSARLPLRLSHRFGTWLGNALILLNSGPARIARQNLASCFPELDNNQQQQLLRQTLQETGKTLFETGRLWHASKDEIARLVKEVRGENHLQNALAQGKGVILAAPHLGSWEMVGMYCSGHYPMTSLYRPPRQQGIEQRVRQARERFGAHLVPTNAKGVRALYQALSKNQLVAILPDQDPRDQGGHFAPFFGIQANTMILLSRLIQKSRATVICGYAERLPDGEGFIVHFLPAPEALYQDDLDASIGALNQMVEQGVRHIPAQYQWTYKRFRTRPAGERDFYSNT